MYKAILTGLTILIFAAIAQAEGKVRVVDGDSIFLGRREIRLSGIDAPEYHQECFDNSGKTYSCGLKSLEYLKKIIGENPDCEEVAIDRYHRHVSVCFSNGEDINLKMVEQGWAVAYDRYSQDYVSAEHEAKAARRGIWQGKFMKPELYRSLIRED